MFDTEYKFPLTVFHGDFKKARGHTLRVSTVYPDGSRAIQLDLTMPAGKRQILEATDIRRVVRSEASTHTTQPFQLFSLGINKQRFPIVCAVFALAAVVPVIPLILKIATASVVSTALLLESRVRVVIETMDGRYACAAMSERAFAMMSTLCNQNI